jgi:diguanylate cyclase (GGDEF)-like protein
MLPPRTREKRAHSAHDPTLLSCLGTLIRRIAMGKRNLQPGREAKARAAPTQLRSATGARRLPAPIDGAEAPPPAKRSEMMRLAAEVERLERELVAARARMIELETRADIDPLTDVLNRRGFERELTRSLAHAKRYGASAALVYIDLDGFKAVNDRHGHAAGDAVLKAVAAVLARHVRASDIVARLGGDEFAVLLWHLTEADAQAKAAVLEAAVARTTATHGGALLSVGASARAVPLLPLDQASDVLERADRAMYARKTARQAGEGDPAPAIGSR